jgi:hypothetical protein
VPQTAAVAGSSHLNPHHRAESEGFTCKVEGGLPNLAPLERPSRESASEPEQVVHLYLHGSE